jgi:lipopolysaccharide biosynthesis glycosyltransferase
MNLIYSAVFFNRNYLNLLDLLLKSYAKFSNEHNSDKYVVLTCAEFKHNIEQMFEKYNINGDIMIYNYNTLFEAACARVYIYDYPDIMKYDKILYLDTDVLVTNNLNTIFDFELQDKLYAVKEGTTGHEFWGGQFFNNNLNIPAFSDGVLLFPNSEPIRILITKIKNHIEQHKKDGKSIPICLDQPFVVYHAITDNLYDIEAICNVVHINPTNNSGQCISHFAGGPGHYGSKIDKMTEYYNKFLK